jgi:hypothetical protein
VTADNDLLQQIQKNPEIQPSLSNALTDKSLPESAKTVIQDALLRLQPDN